MVQNLKINYLQLSYIMLRYAQGSLLINIDFADLSSLAI
jgi:hypothetical protein